MATKLAHFGRISPDILDRISESFYHMKAVYERMIDLYLIFQIFKGRCHGNQIMLQKRYQRQLIALAFIALVLENELQYHGIAERSKSTNDAYISCENFLKFGPVTSELTALICEREVRHGQKTGVFRGISSDILDRFSQSFHHMKALYVQMMDMFLMFQFIKGRCHGNQIILP